MSFWGTTKNAAKFVFVRIPAGVLGVRTLRQNNETIRQLYETLRNPVCPMCSGGVLTVQDGGVASGQDPDPRMKYTWACSQCDFMLLGGHDKRSVIPTLAAMRQERALSHFDGLADDERLRLMRSHTLHSRIFFIAALLIFLGFCAMLVRGSGLLLSFNWFTLSLCLFIFGLKKSYRAWQVENGVLYVRGAFKTWFNNERWIR